MKQLVFIQDNKPVTDSLTVAEVFEKEHNKVLRDIDNVIQKLHEPVYLPNGELDQKTMEANKKFSLSNFGQSDYKNSRGQTYRKYNLSEEAFTIVAMGYTDVKAMAMKVKFIQEFKRMREYIEQNKVKVLDDRTALIQSLKLTAETAERTDVLEKVVNQQQQKLIEIEYKVEEQITLDHGEQRRLQRAVATKVYELSDDKNERSRLFRELHREIKDRFGVASYKDVKRMELQTALRYIENWVPKKVS